MELIIVLLMFAFPITAALIGNSKKKNSSATAQKKPQTEATQKPVFVAREHTDKTFTPKETHHTTEYSRQTEKKAPSLGKSAEGIKAEKKKLIIYSEILKPKFDE